MLLALHILVLAVIQGLTEFIPVSSSGHLVLGQAWIGLTLPGLTLEIVLHAGTLISVLIYYRHRIMTLIVECVSGRGEGRHYAGWLILASVPAAFFYAVAGKRIEWLFDRPRLVGLLLVLNGILLLSQYRIKHQNKRLRWPLALAIGMAQAGALLPGISRSGSTIGLARLLGLDPRRAAEFSLLMSVPAVTGAVLYDSLKLIAHPPSDILAATPFLIMGLAVSALVGWLAIACIVRVLMAGRFWMFGGYCLVIGSLAALLLKS